MTAPLGVRICPELGCGRRIHVTVSGIVYARCVAHTLSRLSGLFDAQVGASAATPSVRRSHPAAEETAALGSRSQG